MRYLSVHDLVWLNARIVGEGTPYDYELLENAMAAQYGYGDSRRIEEQAARLAEALAVARPFRAGNLRSALLATSVFLMANGREVGAPGAEVRAVVNALATGEASGERLVEALASGSELQQSSADMRTLITDLTHRLAAVLAEAGDRDPVVEPWTVSEHLHRS